MFQTFWMYYDWFFFKIEVFLFLIYSFLLLCFWELKFYLPCFNCWWCSPVRLLFDILSFSFQFRFSSVSVLNCFHYFIELFVFSWSSLRDLCIASLRSLIVKSLSYVLGNLDFIGPLVVWLLASGEHILMWKSVSVLLVLVNE